jgi:PPOX class probable F420-dependent enzyme
MEKIPESQRDLLQDRTRAFAFLATVMPDGSPQVTPVWFNTDGNHILINSAEGRAKVKNMRARKHVALAIIDPDDPYRYIQIRGRVLEIIHQGAREHIDALAKKYTGADRFNPEKPGEIRVIFKIKTDHVFPKA